MSKTRAHVQYMVDGKRVRGATTIIGKNLGWGSGGLIHWAWDLGMQGEDYRKVRDKAADIGTLAHKMIEGHWTGEKPDPAQWAPADWAKAEEAFGAFLAWASQHDIVPMANELSLVHDGLGYGGTLDMPATVDGRLVYIDYKTGKAVYPSALLQAAAYIELLRYHWDGVEADVIILHVNKETGQFTPHEYTYAALRPAFEAFKAVLRLDELEPQIKV